MATPFTLVDGSDATVLPARVAEGRVYLDPDGLRDTLGWQLSDEGLCRGEICVPIGDWEELVGSEGIELGAFAAALGRPLAADVEEAAAALGIGASERAASLLSLEAPDFELPDLAGQPHRLSQHRGKKVLLVAYASW